MDSRAHCTGAVISATSPRLTAGVVGSGVAHPGAARPVATPVVVALFLATLLACGRAEVPTALGQHPSGHGWPPPGMVVPDRPPWAAAAPLREVALALQNELPAAQNGHRLQAAVDALRPGDRLAIGPGHWELPATLRIEVGGREDAPVWIVAAAGGVTRLTAERDQNVVHIGRFDEQAERIGYLVLSGLELMGGSTGLRIYGADHVWVDGCEIHHTGSTGLTANTRDNEDLWLTANHVHHTSGYGEGMYLGRDDGSAVLSRSVVARNHVHHTGGRQGDGIELKQGCWGNLIVANRIHDTDGPCLVLYGTHGRPRNVVARNDLARSGDHVLQVQGEALVVDNRIADGRTGIFSADHRGRCRDLELRGNVVDNPGGIAVDLSGWRDRPGLLVDDNVFVGEVRWPDGP